MESHGLRWIREFWQSPNAVLCKNGLLPTVQADGLTPSIFTSSISRSQPAEEVAAQMRAKEALGIGGGISVANPIPEADEIPRAEIDAIIEQALADLARLGITGKDITPYLLGRIVEITGGASLKANIALVRNNAHLGAAIAIAFAG